MERNPAEDMGWYLPVTQLPDMPHQGHLAPVLAGHEFQESFKNYRDLIYLDHNLAEWHDKIGIYGDMLDNRRKAFAERLPQVRGVTEISNPPWSPIVNSTGLARAPDADATAVRTYLNFVGYDFSDEGIAAGHREAQTLGLSNARFEVKDVATLDGSTKFDLITVFDAIHDQAKPRTVLKGIHDSLKAGGVFLCSDIHANSNVAENIGHPMAPMMYMVSPFHCMTVSLALGGEGLGTMWGEQKALELFAEAGFSDVRIEHVEGDPMNSYYIARP